MSKSRDAFRTISEVSTALDTPAHVLRFWESKFTQVKPVKRAGGRRYYRPADVNLLAGIKQLLHEDGMTIKGAQKLLREQGVKHVAAIGSDILEGVEPVDFDLTAEAVEVETPTDAPKTNDNEPISPVSTGETASPAPKPTAEIDITNIVNMQRKTQSPETGPALTLNIEGVEENQTTPPPEVSERIDPADETTALVMPDVPADPSDSDSKAAARVFHLFQNMPATRLALRRQEIAPLLDRMQILRDRVANR